MDMSLGDDDALFEGQLSPGADQGAAGCAGDVAGLADDAGDADLSGVGQGELYLGFLSDGAKDGHVFIRSLRTGHGETFFAEKLPRLAQILDRMGLIMAEQEGKVFL